MKNAISNVKIAEYDLDTSNENDKINDIDELGHCRDKNESDEINLNKKDDGYVNDQSDNKTLENNQIEKEKYDVKINDDKCLNKSEG